MRNRGLRRGVGLALCGLVALFWGPAAFGAEPGEPAAGKMAASAQEVRPLLVGASVPGARLQTVDGQPFDLRAAVREKPTVLIFYRGGW